MTLDEVRQWATGFPESSYAREALDTLFRELSIAQASAEMRAAHGARLAAAWRVLQKQLSDYDVDDAFNDMDKKLIAEGSIEDSREATKRDQWGGTHDAAKAELAEFLAAPGPFDVSDAEAAEVDRAIGGDENKPKCDDPKCGCHE